MTLIRSIFTSWLSLPLPMKALTIMLLATMPVASMGQVPHDENPTRKPNVIVIVTDDGGWADFGFNGCKDYPTSNMDRIAREGVNFHAGYVTAPVCSPSRAGLLAGRNQSFFGHEYNILGKRSQGLPLTETLISQRFKALGYSTAAFGKWHLGGDKGYQPFERGFDVSYGFISGGRGYLGETHKTPKDADDAWRRNGTPVIEREYATDAIGRECVDFIAKSAGKPFFIYAAFNCPHSPMQAKPGYEAAFEQIADKKRRTLAAMMKSQDEAVGKILESLKANQIDNDTIVWLINDNGAGTYGKFDNGPWRDFKGSLFEGGIRVAFAVRWPGRIPSGVIYRHPVTSLDISATSLTVAGIDNLNGLDGVNLLPFLQDGNEGRPPHEALFWSYRPAGVVRHGDWKLILVDGKPAALYNLKVDPGERVNRMVSDSSKASELSAMFGSWSVKTAEPLWRGDDEGLSNGTRKKHISP